MVAMDLFIPSLTSGLSFWIWSSIQKIKISFLVVSIEKLIRIFSTQLSLLLFLRFCVRILFIYNIEKIIKHILKILQCLYYITLLFKNMFNHYVSIMLTIT